MATKQPDPERAHKTASPTKPGRLHKLRTLVLPTRWKASAGLGLIAGFGTAASYPPFGLWPFVILSLWASIHAADPTGRADAVRTNRYSALWFGLGTIPAWAWLTRWAASGALAGYPLLVLYLAGFSALSVWVISRFRHRFSRIPAIVSIPILWAGVEAVRGLIAFNGFPWYLAEYPLIDAVVAGIPVLAWPAMFGGVWLVSLILAAVTVLVSSALRNENGLRSLLCAAGLIAAWVGLGFVFVKSKQPDPIARVAILQTNVPQSIKAGWSFDDRWKDWLELRRLIVAAGTPEEGTPRPDFMVIPETMFPGLALQTDAAEIERGAGVVWPLEAGGIGTPRSVRAQTIRDQLIDVSRRIGVPIFIGATRFEGFRIDRVDRDMFYKHDARYNSVFLLDRGEVSPNSYDKQELTPFGEVMPYISAWPWLERMFLTVAARGMSFDLEAGTTPTVFEIPNGDGSQVRLVTPICYEATVGDVCRHLVFDGADRRADVLVNMTNDGWFYEADGGREMHLLTARWRSLELASPMVRSANSGISAVVGVRGQILASLAPHEAKVLLEDVPGSGDVTLYARIGDLIGWISGLAAIFGAALTYIPMQRKRGDQGDVSESGDPKTES